MEKITGLIDAPFTPMLPNGDINLAPIPQYASMLARNEEIELRRQLEEIGFFERCNVL